MALSAADLNQARVNILGTTVDATGAAWTTAPPANANTLNTPQRIINRAINQLSIDAVGVLGTVTALANRFSQVVGDEAVGASDEAAFQSIGSNLIQAVAALIAGGGAVVPPTPLAFTFEFPDPLDVADFVDVVVTEDCTIPAGLAGTEYLGMPEPDDMAFELTTNSTVIGEIEVGAGNVVTLTGIGGDVAAGTTLRMTASSIVGGPISPNVKITIAAERKAAPPPAVGRVEFPQVTAATEWTINHGLNQRLVTVQVIDTSGNRVIPADVDYDTVNRCIVSFARPKAGVAVVRT